MEGDLIERLRENRWWAAMPMKAKQAGDMIHADPHSSFKSYQLRNKED